MQILIAATPVEAVRPHRLLRVIGMLVVAIAVSAGVWFRTTAVDRKFFWLDEVHAAMLRSGNNESDVLALFDGTPRPLNELTRFVHPEASTSLLAPAEALAERHPIHPPLFYCLLRAWSAAFGDSVGATRGFSVFFSLLCFPAVYWLGREMFRSTTAAWTAVALWAVSPFEVLYAQEAKQYSMFALTILLSSAALLRSMRKRTFASWSGYAVAVSLGWYTHLLFAPVFAAQGLFVVLSQVGRLQRRRTWTMFAQFAASATAGLLTFAPWIVVCLTDGRDAATRIAAVHMADAQRFAWLVAAWISNLGCTFVDLGAPSSPLAGSLFSLLWLAVIALAVYAFCFLGRRSLTPTWILLLTLALLPPLVLMVPDVVLGGGRSMLVRYWTATSIALLFAVAGTFSRQLASSSVVRRSLSAATLLLLLALGVESCRRSAGADFWWNKDGVINNQRNAAADYANMRRALSILSRVEKPLIVTEAGRFQECELLIFTYYTQAPQIEWLGTLNPDEGLVLPDDRLIVVYDAPQTVEHLHHDGWKFVALDPTRTFLLATRDPAKLKEMLPPAESMPVPANDVARGGEE